VFLSVRAEALDEQAFEPLRFIQTAAKFVVSTEVAVNSGGDLFPVDCENFRHRLLDLSDNLLSDRTT
jgi:hypothetical protein